MLKSQWERHKPRFLSALVVLSLSGLISLGRGLPSAWAASSISVGVKAHILHPPNAVTNLSAAAVGALHGDIQLAWHAPGNLNGMVMQRYYVRYATYPAINPSMAETWWAENSATQNTINSAQPPGIQEFVILHGFTVGTRYYFGIKAIDTDGQISAIDNRVGLASQAQSYPVDLSGSPPATPTNFTGSALSTTSVQWTWDNTPSASFYTVNSYPLGVLIDQTTSQFIIESGHLPNTRLSRTVRAGNFNGLSAPSIVETVHTLAAVPSNVRITQVWFTAIALAWNNSGNVAATQYRIERSDDGLNFIPIALSTNTTLLDTGLLEETTYYYRLRAVNGDGLLTAPSVAVSTYTPRQIDYVAPGQPTGLKGSLDSSRNVFTMSWEPVIANEDNTPINDIYGYDIYRRTSLTGAATKVTAVPLTVTAYADQVNGQVYYYTVVAIDNSGNVSAPSLFVDSSVDTNVIYLSTDSVSSIIMPDSVNDLLRSGFNGYSVPLTIRMQEQPIPSATDIVREVRFQFVRSDTGEAVNDVAFSKPEAIVGLGYASSGGNIVTGAPNQTIQSQAVTSATPDDLSMFFYNGVTWIKVGGTLDVLEKALKTKTSYLGQYQLRIEARSMVVNLDPANVFPRVFTPNGDGFNDRVYFVVENPNNASVSGEIYDSRGRIITTLPPAEESAGIGTTLYWDGRDKQGVRVPSGVYTYKIQGEGRSFTGTVAVAR